MKVFARLANIGLPLFLGASLFLAGCGDEESSGGSPAARFKTAMLDLSKRMVKIAEGIESAEDAAAAEPKVEELMDEVVALLNGIVNDVDTMTEKDKVEFESVVTDPELKEWNEKMIAQMDKLNNEHPEAAVKLEEIMRRQSQKLGVAMDALARRMAEKMQGTEGGRPRPPVQDTSGAVPDSSAADTTTVK